MRIWLNNLLDFNISFTYFVRCVCTEWSACFFFGKTSVIIKMTNKSTSSIKQRRKTIEKVTLLDWSLSGRSHPGYFPYIDCLRDDASDCGTLCIPVAASLAGGVLPMLLCLIGKDCYRLLYPEWQYASGGCCHQPVPQRDCICPGYLFQNSGNGVLFHYVKSSV